MTKQDARTWFWSHLRENMFRWVMTGVALLALFLARPYLEAIKKMADLPAQVEALNEKLDVQTATITDRVDELALQVDDLRRPTLIFKIGPTSGPVEGFCVAGRPGDFVFILARYPRGADCDIVPGTVRYIYYNEDLTQQIEVGAIEGSSTVRNRTEVWSQFPIGLETPRNLRGEAFVTITATYNHCLGQDDSVEVTQESELIPVLINPL